MIRVLNKKQQKEAKKPRFLPPDNIKHETEIAAGKLQAKLTENQTTESANRILTDENERLKNTYISMQVIMGQVNAEITKKRSSIAGIDELIGIRSSTLENINKILAKLSDDKGRVVTKLVEESKKLTEFTRQYNELSVKYNGLLPKIAALEKTRKQEEAIIKSVKEETKVTKLENKKRKAEYESYKTLESKTIERMKFFGDRINRFYSERQMKPPIELPF